MADAQIPPTDTEDHRRGHRERLRARFRKGGAESLAEYELLELLLFRSIPIKKCNNEALFHRVNSVPKLLHDSISSTSLEALNVHALLKNTTCCQSIFVQAC